MLILQKEENNKGSFHIQKNSELVAEMTYRKEPGRMIIEHTEVDEFLRGQNIGFSLIERAVDYARQQKLAIVPLCTFAKKMIDRHPELQDVL